MAVRRRRQGRGLGIAPMVLGGLVVTALSLACQPQPILEPTFVPIQAAAEGVRATGADDRDGAGARPDRLEDYPEALGAIVDIFDQELGLPRPDVTLVLFANQRSFEAGLLSIGYPPDLARNASTFGAIGGARAVLANGSVLDAMAWQERVRLLAHELTHSVQYVFAGGHRGASEQWLREGMADWVAFRTIETLGYASYRQSRRRVLDRLAHAPRDAAPAPLATLGTFPQWVAAQQAYQDLPLYTQAFLGAELLIEQHGFETLLEYFAAFASSDDRAGIFRATFGRDLADFERALHTRWSQELASHHLLR